MSKRATAISAITSRRSPTAPTRTSSAIMAGSKSPGRTRRIRTTVTENSGPVPRPTSSIRAKGSHTLKVGGELLKELQWFGVLQGVGGDIEHVYNNGASNQVIFRIPTATQVGGLKDNDQGHLTTENALDQSSMFVNDTWTTGRSDAERRRQVGSIQGLVARTGPAGCHGRPGRRPGQDVREDGPVHLESVCAPHRCGVRPHRRRPDRVERQLRSLLAQSRRRRTQRRESEYRRPSRRLTVGTTAGVINGDKRWQAGEQTALQTASLEGAIQLDPNIKAPYSHEAAGWFERQFTDTIGVRAGFVYKTENDLIEHYIAARGLDVYTRAVHLHGHRRRRRARHGRRSRHHDTSACRQRMRRRSSRRRKWR